MAPSLWRRPGTKTFQLVHRSQRDPLINDPEASERVLKQVDKSQKGTYHATEQPLESTDPTLASSSKIEESPFAGDASSYGIYFDDTEYDYLQHLRTVGNGSTGGAEAFLVEAPVKSTKQSKGKGKDSIAGFEERRRDFEMPEEVLPSHPLDEVSYSKYLDQKEGLGGGLQPDLDPRLREVLEALDDEAYAVDDGEGTDGEDEFWGGVLQGGEGDGFWEGDEEEEEGEGDEMSVEKRVERLKLANGDEVEGIVGEGHEWDAVKRFKKQQQEREQVDSDDEEFESEMGDTIAELVKSSLRRPARGVRKANSAAGGSSFSMSSSAMVRNEGLRTLDDRFDQIEKLYDESDDDSWGGGSDDSDGEGGELHGPQRQDLEAIMDDFLSKYEVIGGKMRQRLDPLTGKDTIGGDEDLREGEDEEARQRRINASKLDRIRASLANLDLEEGGEGQERRKEKERILKIVERQEREEERRARKGLGLGTPKVDILEDRKRERWDCETVLSTYSNMSNHPRLLRIRDNKLRAPKPAQIKLDPKTGFPLVDGKIVTGREGDTVMGDENGDKIEEEDEEEEEEEEYVPRETIKRARSETTEEKKARKAAVKQERSSRRQQKTATKETFDKEVKRQKKVQGRRVAEGGAADIRPGVEGVRRLA